MTHKTESVMTYHIFQDQTFGWNGYMSGFGVYYYHFTKQQDIKSDQVLLSPDLAPVIDIQNVKRTYLGYPYTVMVRRLVYSSLVQSSIYSIYSIYSL